MRDNFNTRQNVKCVCFLNKSFSVQNLPNHITQVYGHLHRQKRIAALHGDGVQADTLNASAHIQLLSRE